MVPHVMNRNNYGSQIESGLWVGTLIPESCDGACGNHARHPDFPSLNSLESKTSPYPRGLHSRGVLFITS